MRKLRMLVCVGMFSALMAGCSGVNGSWKLAKVTPKEDHKEFTVANLELKRDNTYSLEADWGDGLSEDSGTYSYNTASRRITFLSDSGDKAEYEAMLWWLEMELHFTPLDEHMGEDHDHDGADGSSDWYAVMTREKM